MPVLLILAAGVFGLTAPSAADVSEASRGRAGRSRAVSRRPLAVALAHELERSRRFGHPLGVVAVGVDPSRLGRRGRRTGWQRQARRTDQIFVIGDAVYIVCPETDREGIPTLVERLVWSLGPDHVRSVAAVSFPEDGLTARALLARLSEAEAEARDRARGAAA